MLLVIFIFIGEFYRTYDKGHKTSANIKPLGVSTLNNADAPHIENGRLFRHCRG